MIGDIASTVCSWSARSVEKGQQAVRQLEEGGLHPVFVQLDVDSKESIKAAREEVATKYGRLDVLINNAGVHIPVSDWAVSNIECDGIYYVIVEIKWSAFGWASKTDHGHQLSRLAQCHQCILGPPTTQQQVIYMYRVMRSGGGGLDLFSLSLGWSCNPFLVPPKNNRFTPLEWFLNESLNIASYITHSLKKAVSYFDVL